MYEFEWHEEKALLNLIKHKISFQEAKTVFDDILALDYFDELHSELEHRNIIVGNSINNRLLFVSYIDKNKKIRIISARLATKNEKKQYEKQCNYFKR